jgi:hypothetical protein
MYKHSEHTSLTKSDDVVRHWVHHVHLHYSTRQGFTQPRGTSVLEIQGDRCTSIQNTRRLQSPMTLYDIGYTTFIYTTVPEAGFYATSGY